MKAFTTPEMELFTTNANCGREHTLFNSVFWGSFNGKQR